jgi:hypothetical protein
MALQFASEPFLTPEDLRCDCALQHIDTAALIDAVSDLLFQASGGIMSGRTETTVRPCAVDCSCGAYSCSECVCCIMDRIPLLGPNPVVSSVKIDGVVLDPDSYAIMDGVYLVQVASGPAAPQPWPASQHLWRPDTEAGTFSITYTHGLAIDFLAKSAAVELTCYIAKEMSSNTLLDPYAATASYEGLTLTRDPDAAESAGFTQLSRFLKTYAPGIRSAVWSPELDEGWVMHSFS